MTKQQALNLLGLAQRASRLTAGEGFVLAAIRDHSAKLVLVASDASANTRKKFSDKGSFYQVPVNFSLTSLELSSAIGRQRSVIAVQDRGFAEKLVKLLT
ncbi:L7Ae/L30e/S12e/Gadd45 family ribosomal protein [Lacticaseibacillus jixianensis]|uniref:L7Ae/L30e/S12e/Gadd45 family ribosomal protein n=1 Tax=Lacticaseibacillus jixianensis TaxID=2486012 RepID=A0ABW4BAS4_9LACO|nr:ribosomal L7Ae/L30e/S12e/Gadd45 family protein [Lacticaseibacillus jixianensis]